MQEIIYLDYLNALTQACEEALRTSITNLDDLEAFRVRFLGTKGLVKEISLKLKTVPPQYRKEYGEFLKEFKRISEEHYTEHKTKLQNGL